MYRGFILFFAFLHIICAIGLRIPTNELATLPTPVIPGDVSTSTRTTSTSTSTPLYLPVTTEAPDPLGMAEISGLFGPGSWSGWFLMLVASWWRIIRVSEEKFDPNTVVFLFCTNWAAVDVWRGIISVQNIPRDAPDYIDRVNRGLGSLGAALNVTIWGTFHAQIQLFVAVIVFRSSKAQLRRLLTHVIGLSLPLITLLRYLTSITDIQSPALYWHGMDSSEHEAVLKYAALMGLFIIAIVMCPVYAAILVLHKAFTHLTKSAIKWAETSKGLEYLERSTKMFGIFSIILLFISTAMLLTKGNLNWAFGFIPFAVFLFVFFSTWNFSYTVSSLFMIYMVYLGTFVWFPVLVIWHAIAYVSKAYLSRSADRSKSCFFMPCAPQSITDEDQLQSLVAGSALFLAFDFVPVIWAKIKVRYTEREEFVREMQERMEELEMRQPLQSTIGREEDQ